jgi:hypothetical protein
MAQNKNKAGVAADPLPAGRCGDGAELPRGQAARRA